MEKEISELENVTGLKAQYGPGANSTRIESFAVDPQKKYKATRGDVVDELLARILNENPTACPVRKLGQNNYMFGTEKISMQAKVNSLLVRIGGGYMDFREYLTTHASKQIDKINALIANDEWNEE